MKEENKDYDDILKMVGEFIVPGTPDDYLMPVSMIQANIGWYLFGKLGYMGDNDNIVIRYVNEIFLVFKFEGVDCAYVKLLPIKELDGSYGLLEQKCDFEQSVYLKILGFNERCESYYQAIHNTANVISDYRISAGKNDRIYPYIDLLMITEWIRSKFNIVITTDFDCDDKRYSYNVLDVVKNRLQIASLYRADTHTDALRLAISYILKTKYNELQPV